MKEKLRTRVKGGRADPSDPLAVDRAQLIPWFENRGDPPYHALLPEFEKILWDDWQAYKKTHPKAQPRYAWLDKPWDPEHEKRDAHLSTFGQPPPPQSEDDD